MVLLCKHQTLLGSYPSSAGCDGSVPTMLLPFNTAVVCLSGKDNSPTATVMIHTVHCDFPVLLFALKNINLQSAAEYDGLVKQIVDVLNKCSLPFILREALHHGLASLLRIAGGSNKFSETLQDLLSLFEQQWISEHDSPSLSKALKSSTYAQSLTEVIAALCGHAKDSSVEAGSSSVVSAPVISTVVKDIVSTSSNNSVQVVPTKKKSASEKKNKFGALHGAVEAIASASRPPKVIITPDSSPSLNRADKSATTTKTKISPASHVLLLPRAQSNVTVQVLDVLSYLRYFEHNSVKRNDCEAHSLVDTTWKSFNEESPFYRTMVLIIDIPHKGGVNSIRQQLIATAAKFSGASTDNVFVEQGKGSEFGAVVCLNVSCRCDSFISALKASPEFSTCKFALGNTVLTGTCSPSVLDGLFNSFVIDRIRNCSNVRHALAEFLVPEIASKEVNGSVVTITELDLIQRADRLSKSWKIQIKSAPAVTFKCPALATPTDMVDCITNVLIEIAATHPKEFALAMLAAGFDENFRRWRPASKESATSGMMRWTHAMDKQLINHVNVRIRSLGIHISNLSPREHLIREVDTFNADFSLLSNVPLWSVRFRLGMFVILNNYLMKILPCLDLHHVNTPDSVANLLAATRFIMFFDSKVEWFNGLLNDSAQRKVSAGAPEVSFDPLQSIGTASAKVDLSHHHFLSALTQLSDCDPALLRVCLPSGGDPMFPLVVRMLGQTVVQGTTGSFREFIFLMSRDICSPDLLILTENRSSGVGRNVGRFTLCTGSVSCNIEKFLQFFGVIIGISLRSDVPLNLDLLPLFWKALVGEVLSANDLADGDKITCDLWQILEALTNEDDFTAYCNKNGPLNFMIQALNGQSIDLLSSIDGSALVTWKTLPRFIALYRQQRLTELSNATRIAAVRRGLASIVPLDALNLFSGRDLELRVCGLPDIDLIFLRSHTTYNVGLTEVLMMVYYLRLLLIDFICRKIVH